MIIEDSFSLNKSDEPRTVEEVAHLLNEHPDSVELHQLLGRLYVAQRDIVRAHEAFMRALELDPNDPFTCLYFGNLCSLYRDKQYARMLFERAVRLKPDLAVSHWAKADFHREQREFQQAHDEYERAVALDPSDCQAQAKLAEWRAFIAGDGD